MVGASQVRLPPADEEADLVEQARSDREAFAALYRRHVDPVYRFCYRRLGSKEAAEDATSQVFAKAFAAFPSFRGGSFQGWLFAIAHRVVIDDRRAARPRIPLTDAAHLPDPAPTPEDQAVRAEQRQQVRAILDRLPTDQRRVLELRLAGLTGPEIAAALGRSHGTVRNTQHRMLLRLRDLLSTAAERSEGRDAR